MKLTIILIIFIMPLLLLSSEEYGWGIGPSFSYEMKSENNIFGADFSYTGFVSTMKSINIPTMMTISLNPRIYKKINIENYSLDLQFTWYFFVNIGGGFGYSSKANYNLASHIFLGLPLGIIDYSKKTLFGFYYVEPYYRLNYIVNEYSHEFGIMIKINTFKIYFE